MQPEVLHDLAVAGSRADLVFRALPSAIWTALFSFVLGLAFFAVQEPQILVWAYRNVLRGARQPLLASQPHKCGRPTSQDGEEEQLADYHLMVKQTKPCHIAAEPVTTASRYSPALPSIPERLQQTCECSRSAVLWQANQAERQPQTSTRSCPDVDNTLAHLRVRHTCYNVVLPSVDGV